MKQRLGLTRLGILCAASALAAAVWAVVYMRELWTVLAIGSLCSGVRSAYIVSIGVLGAPSLLTVPGVDPLKWVGPLVPEKPENLNFR